MKRNLLTFIAIFALAFGVNAQNVFFSQYCEPDAGNHKAIEFYNGTGADLDLSTVVIKQSHGGEGFDVVPADYNLALSGTLAAGDVYVIAADEADQVILDASDLLITYGVGDGGKVIFFTGDDAMGLFIDGTLVDVIGLPDDVPVDGWDVAGVTAATKDHTLIRKSSVTTGQTVWATAAGTDASSSEWIVYDANTEWASLGSHTTSAIASIENINFTMYPNPVNNVLYVKAQNASKIVISNAIGQEVRTVENVNATTTVEVSGLQSGLYFVRVETVNGTMVQKFIKK